MTHRNETLLRKGYDAFGRGDIETVLSVFADDIQWHEFGTGPLAGDYKGKEEVLGIFGKLMELTGGTFQLKVEDLLVNDRYVVVMVEEHAQRNGKSLTVDAVHVWEIANDTASAFWAYSPDQAAIDDFLS